MFFEVGSTVLLFIRTALTHWMGHPFNPGLPVFRHLVCESYAPAPTGAERSAYPCWYETMAQGMHEHGREAHPTGSYRYSADNVAHRCARVGQTDND
ncbi:MAG: hypothetical protein KatS3mg056_1543 [Chloroflexus sp.]|jgi:hypothetical protein|nr:MAG: hypothetical protein KatS3mg056_1543 [Chloroflexus sp.]